MADRLDSLMPLDILLRTALIAPSEGIAGILNGFLVPSTAVGKDTAGRSQSRILLLLRNGRSRSLHPIQQCDLGIMVTLG